VLAMTACATTLVPHPTHHRTSRSTPTTQVVRQLCSNLDVLRTVYEAFADFVEGVQVLKLATSGTGAGGGGLYKLLELYDITPTYLSKVEAKVLFTLTLHAQVGW
jgi:hypothetical protein